MTFGPANTNAIYLPTTQYFPEDAEKFRAVLTFVYSDIARRLNDKEIGLFDLVEFLNGQQWFTTGNPQIKRQAFRKVFPLPATGAGVTTNIAHGITGVGTTTTFTHIYGTAVTTAPDNRPIPFASATLVTDQIQILVNATNIVVTNGATAPGITQGVIVVEYLKN